jgi:hypothetical protein
VKPFNNVGRVIAAAYIGALIAGPAPFGWVSTCIANRCSTSVGLTVLIATLIFPWLIAGFLAGRRLGLLAAPVGYYFWQSHFIRQSVSEDFRFTLAFMLYGLIPLAVGWMGSLLASRMPAGKSLEGRHHWWIAGFIALVLSIYTLTIAPTLALHAMQARFASIWPADSEQVNAYAAGAYTGVDICINEWGVPDTCYLDPSGLIFFYKVNLD